MNIWHINMLILNETRPNLSLYYLGASLIQFFYQTGIKEIHLTDLYQKYNDFFPITFNRFMLVLDWLFMLGILGESKKGCLKCILNR